MEIIVGLIIFIIVDIIFLNCLDKHEKSKGEANYRAYQQAVSENLKKSEFGKGYGIKCPNCGQENVKYISTASRAISVGTVGLASNKIGETYKCPKCGYMW